MNHRMQSAQEIINGIFFWNGRIRVADGKLYVSPANVAALYAGRIKTYKREILILGAHCPECAEPLKVTQYPEGQIRECVTGHYDEFRK